MEYKQDTISRMNSDKTNLSRRDLVQRAAWAIAAAALPGGVQLAAQDVSPNVSTVISPMMLKLSTYMSEARDSALPEKVLQETKHHILDTFAAMISGSELPPGRMALKFARAYGGPSICTVVASDVLLGPIEAAIANGELAHSDETDDDYTGGGAHPGSAIVPAALAIGEKAGITGQHFTRAVALGYDIGMRAYETVGAGPILKDTHILVGTFGAAATAGCALSLNAQQMRWLIDYAAQQAGAGFATWRRDTDHIEKGFVFGGSSARTRCSRPRSRSRRACSSCCGVQLGLRLFKLASAPARENMRLGSISPPSIFTLRVWLSIK